MHCANNRRVLEIRDAALALGDGCGLVFPPMRSGRPKAPSTPPKMLRPRKIAPFALSFRSPFRDGKAWETDHPCKVTAVAPAHVGRNKVEAVYARSDRFERLMEDWADYLAGDGRWCLLAAGA